MGDEKNYLLSVIIFYFLCNCLQCISRFFFSSCLESMLKVPELMDAESYCVMRYMIQYLSRRIEPRYYYNRVGVATLEAICGDKIIKCARNGSELFLYEGLEKLPLPKSIISKIMNQHTFHYYKNVVLKECS